MSFETLCSLLRVFPLFVLIQRGAQVQSSPINCLATPCLQTAIRVRSPIPMMRSSSSSHDRVRASRMRKEVERFLRPSRILPHDERLFRRFAYKNENHDHELSPPHDEERRENGSERIIYGAAIPKELRHTIQRQTLGEYLVNACKEHANKTWLIDSETKDSITCKAVLDKSRKVIELLMKSGASFGSVIGIVSENSLHYPSILLAALQIGAIFTSMDPKNTKNELLHLFNVSKPSIVFTTSDFHEKVESVRMECDFAVLVIDIGTIVWPENDDTGDMQYNKEDRIQSTDTAVIIYTSGSTGLPKGVMLSHKALIYPLELYKTKLVNTYDRTDADVVSAQSAMYYPYGFRITLMSLVLGKKFVLLKGRVNEVSLLRYIQEFKINAMFMFPAFAAFLAKDDQVNSYDTSSIKILSCAGDLLQSDIKERVKQRLGCDFFDQYAMSETGLTIFEGLVRPSSKIGITGHLMPGLMAKIVDPQTQEALAPFQEGEFCVKGPSLFNGYLGGAKTEEAFYDDGWFRTGDLAFYDDDEDLRIVGRLKQVIKYRTSQVSPPEIEMLILQHPDVAAAGVIGVPHDVDGERARAYVVKKPGSVVTEDDIIQYVASNISSAKQLHGGVEFVDELPKTGSGKINRKMIKQRLLASRGD